MMKEAKSARQTVEQCTGGQRLCAKILCMRMWGRGEGGTEMPIEGGRGEQEGFKSGCKHRYQTFQKQVKANLWHGQIG